MSNHCIMSSRDLRLIGLESVESIKVDLNTRVC